MDVQRPQSIRRAVYPYLGLTFIAAAVFLGVSKWELPLQPDPFWNCLAAFFVVAFAAEAAFLRLPIGGSSSSVAFIPYLASIVLMGPAWTMALAGATEFAVETAVRRKPLIKVLFNTANHITTIGFAGIAYMSLGGTFSISSFDPSVSAFFAFFAAAATFFAVNTGGAAVAIALSSGTSLRRTWNRLAGGSLLFDFLASPLALLLAFLYTKAELIGILVVGVPLFLVRHIYSVNLKLEQVNRDLLELMVKAIEARDPYTSGHSLRVSRMARILATELGLTGRQVEQVETAALLHDVGKIYEEYAPILRKEGRLTPEEMALMRTHALRGYELVRTISGFRGGVDAIVRNHHENFDGTGYPDGLSGENIPLGARIIMVADTTDAMTTDRPYRSALGYADVIEELDRFAGRQFDPLVVAAFKKSVAARAIYTPQEPVDSVPATPGVLSVAGGRMKLVAR